MLAMETVNGKYRPWSTTSYDMAKDVTKLSCCFVVKEKLEFLFINISLDNVKGKLKQVLAEAHKMGQII